jgi:hypothetical protein
LLAVQVEFLAALQTVAQAAALADIRLVGLLWLQLAL